MLECELFPDHCRGQATNRQLEGGIQSRTTTQQFGIPDAGRICSPGSPFAFLNGHKAGAQAVKAKMHSLRSALTALRAGLRISKMKAKGLSQRRFMVQFLSYDW